LSPDAALSQRSDLIAAIMLGRVKRFVGALQ
jgi:hypothetical protein